MYAVPIRELKAKLSEYIRKARNGDIVLITDRGQVVAELRFPTVKEASADELGPLYELSRSGLLQRGGQPDPSVYRPSKLNQPSGTANELLDWLRAEGKQEGS